VNDADLGHLNIREPFSFEEVMIILYERVREVKDNLVLEEIRTYRLFLLHDKKSSEIPLPGPILTSTRNIDDPDGIIPIVHVWDITTIRGKVIIT